MMTPIQNFYTGQNIFITGGTGFLGKALVEKLLRSCNVSKIYLLIRSKKGININDRLDNLFNNPLFDNLKKNIPDFRNKIVPITGDIEEINLGLSPENHKLLIEEVSIVFHSAATVKFNEKLKTALSINTSGTLNVLKLMNEIKNLKVMVYVSTAYSNCHKDIIEEQIYPHVFDYENLKIATDTLSDKAIDDAQSSIIKNWPNTYTFTKALTEKVVRQMSFNKPVGIFRPGAIISAFEEPLPGWVDNYYGPTGYVTAASLGILKISQINPNVIANLVPVDYTVNALIVCAWNIATQITKRNDDMLIYNYVSTTDAPILWDDFFKNCVKYGHKYPILQSTGYMKFSLTKNKLAFNLSMIFLHFIPALIIDFMILLTGKKPKLYKILNNTYKYSNIVRYFVMRDWNWKSDNVSLMWKRLNQDDQKIFKFSFTGFNWKEYCKNYMMGIKVYILKENLNTLEASKKRQKKLRIIHEGFNLFCGFILLWLLFKIFNFFI